MNIRIENLSKDYGAGKNQTQVLSDINLDIRDKEFFVLLGSSGCGKSTLLNLIAGLNSSGAGLIWFGDKLAADFSKNKCLTPQERNVAMVFQSYALYPHLSVYQNIAFPLRMDHVSKSEIDKAVNEAAELLELTPVLKSKPFQLSGGQRQRVSIARALVRKPDLFLMDEPLSNLDAKLRASMRHELAALQKKLGITTIYVTHDQTEAITLGHRIAVLNQGRIEQIGTPKELYEKPANPFVATFVGTPAMNLFEVTLSQKGTGCSNLSPFGLLFPHPKPAGKYLLGIRPEHLQVNAPAEASLKARIRFKEMLGRESLLHVEIAGQNAVVLVKSAVPASGEITLSFSWKHTHWFPCP